MAHRYQPALAACNFKRFRAIFGRIRAGLGRWPVQFRILTGFRQPAQGCPVMGTTRGRLMDFFNPKGIVACVL